MESWRHCFPASRPKQEIPESVLKDEVPGYEPEPWSVEAMLLRVIQSYEGQYHFNIAYNRSVAETRRRVLELKDQLDRVRSGATQSPL